jgi:alkylation response protein AidB-like acyl-CoA dehydrogenase
VDLTLNSDQLALRAGIREYLADKWDASRLRSAASGAPLTAEDWKELAGLGVFGLLLPESSGGMGLGLADAAIVFEELGAALVPGPLVPTVLAAGTLVGTASGTLVSTASGTVPGAADGDAIVAMLDASAPGPAVIEHLGLATHVVVVSDDGLFLIPAPELASMSAGSAEPLDPLTPVAVATGDVPALMSRAERVGSAADAALWRLRGAVLVAALQVGVAQGGLDLGVRYVTEREQFGRVVGSFQAVKHLLAESLVRVELARAAMLAAAVAADDPGAGDLAVGDLAVAVATAKVLADDAATTGGRTCVQVHGGMGFTWEVLAHLYLKRAWVQETAFSTTAEHEAFLATQLG